MRADKVKGLDKNKNAEYRKRYYQKNPWAKHYALASSRCSCKKTYVERGFKVEVTTQDLKDIWFRDKAYLLKEPSLDRRDNARGYTKDNCQFIEYEENKVKDSKKPVVMESRQGEQLIIFESKASVVRFLGGGCFNLWRACTNQNYTFKKHKWNFWKVKGE